MGDVTIRGHSDDLIEVDGSICEELPSSYSDSDILAFSDGTVLRLESVTGWRIKPVTRGAADLTTEPDPDEYSDRARPSGDVRWGVLGTAIGYARKGSA